jgi:hypothetical protein
MLEDMAGARVMGQRHRGGELMQNHSEARADNTRRQTTNENYGEVSPSLPSPPTPFMMPREGSLKGSERAEKIREKVNFILCHFPLDASDALGEKGERKEKVRQ